MSKFTPLFLCFVFLFIAGFSEDIKEADLAGSWYTSSAAALKKQIEGYLAAADSPFLEGQIISLICPHAGIIYSGGVAASGFKAVKDKKIDRVILIGFHHRLDNLYYDGIAVFNQKGFKTPLGVLYTDKDLAEKIILENKKIFVQPGAFDQENSLELILPFIQVALGSPRVLLLAIGRQSFENSKVLAEALFEVLKDKDNYLIIASSDLSHYLPLAQAEKEDLATIDLIKKMDPQEAFWESSGQNRLCGTASVVAAMMAAKKLGADKFKVLNYSTSASTSKDKSAVVGYLSAAFIKSNNKEKKEEDEMSELLTAKQKKELLKLARDTIGLYLNKKEILNREFSDPKLKEVMGVFVTLHKNNQLRGCIGNIVGQKPLYLGVRDMSLASAREDPRFPPVTESELDYLDIEISVLSPLEKISTPDKIIMGKHGVLVKKGFQSGVYLPQVATETGWSRDEFMNSLCAHKAGLAADCWKKGECEIYLFSAEVFGEKEAKDE